MQKPRIFKLMVFILLAGSAAGLLSFPLWLDSPRRSNPNDPKSFNFHTPVPFPTVYTAPPVASVTMTMTFSITPTFSVSPTYAGTATPTPTASPTPSVTSTPPKWYDGESAPYRLSDLNASADTDLSPGKGALGISEASAGGGAAGSSNYLKITCSAGAGTWYDRAVLATSGAPLDLASVNTLSLYIRVPSNACANSFHPAIQMRCSGAYPNDRSAGLTATAYLVGTTALSYDSWIELRIPLAAFVGPNSDGGSFPAAGLNAMTALVIAASDGMFGGGGDLPLSEIHVDQISFLNLTTPPAVSSRGMMFDDFENASSTLWARQAWQFSADGLPCTPTTSVSFPGAAAAPIDLGGNSLSACHAGHMMGTQSSAAPCVWSPSPPDPWPLVRMMVDMWQGPLNLSNNAIVTGLPASGAHGMRIRMKRGTASPGQLYSIQLLRTATNADWDNYHFRVLDDDLSTSWQTYQVAFPPDGQAAGFQNHASNATELFWGQEGWGAPATWQRSDFLKLIIRVKNGGTFDVWVDDIEFY